MTVLLFSAFLPAQAGTLRLDMLEVGQGDSFLVTTPEGTRILIDAGTSGSDVADQLLRMGVSELDMAFGTHAHADHIGGMREVLERLEVSLYIDSGLEHTTATYRAVMRQVQEDKLSYKEADTSMSWTLDDEILLEVLWPPRPYLSGTRSDLNSNSVVLQLTHGENCFLFTGDAEEVTEHGLIQSGALEECEVLKVAHHGSNHSSSQSFIDKVSPEILLISAGPGNRYKHPGEETMERLLELEVPIYRTDLTGHVTVQSDGTFLEVTDGIPMEPVENPENVAQEVSIRR